MRGITLAAALLGSASLVHAGVAAQHEDVAAAESYGIAGYWGEDNERSLADYCGDGEDVDIVIVSFLSNFGGGNYPNTGSSGIDNGCSINVDGSSSGCEQIGQDISTCQNMGKKVFLSTGGAAAQFQINGNADAQGIASSLWNSYANPSVTDNTHRPFGNAIVDGWDFDIESNQASGSNNEYLGELVATLRNYFSDDPSRSYYISGAPECPVNPIDYMGDSISFAQYDYLWIQFYNNPCGATKSGYNFPSWPAALANGASANAKLYVGIPASPSAADHPEDFVAESDLDSLFEKAKDVANFAGFMVYDLGASDTETSNNCNYVQNLASVISSGKPC